MTNQYESHHITKPRSMIQKMTIGVGIYLVFVGVMGMMLPGFLTLHLGLSNNVIHLLTGSFAIWCGYSDSARKAYSYSLGFGTFFAILGLGGFIIGEPGYPGVGYMEADEYLLRVIPNILEFGSMDHVEHIVLAAVLLLSSYAWVKRSQDAGRSIVDVQSRLDNKDVHNVSALESHRRNQLNSRSDSERRL